MRKRNPSGAKYGVVPEVDRRLRSKVNLLFLCAISAAAFALRTLNWRSIFVGGNVRFISPDAFFHMRRVFIAVSGNLAIPEYDAFMNFPRGLHCNLPPLFDQIVAGIALLLGRGHPSIQLVESVGALVPPVLGTLTVVIVFFIARTYLDDKFALLAAAVLTLLPYHIQVSVLGRPDHHVAVALFSSVLFLLIIVLAGKYRLRSICVFSILAGFMLFVNLAMWGGSLLFVVILFIYFGARILLDIGKAGRLDRGAIGGCCVFLAAAFFMWLATSRSCRAETAQLTWGALGRFQVLLLLCCSTAVFAMKVLVEMFRDWRDGPGLVSRLRPGIILLALLAACVVLMVHSGFFGFLDAGSRWLFKDDPIQQYVVEESRLSWRAALEDFSGLVVLFPLAIALICYRSWKQGRAERGVLLCVWSIVVGISTVLQERFADLFSVNAAILNAYLISIPFRGVSSPPPSPEKPVRPRRSAKMRTALAAVCIAALCFAAWPTGKWLRFYWRSARAPHVLWEAVYDICLWLRRNTPSTPGYLDASGKPDYSVLAKWDMGHAILYIAQRANVANNLIGWEENREENLKPYRFLVAGDVAEAESILDECRAKYIIVDEMVSSGNFARMIDVLGMNHDDFFIAEETASGMSYTTRRRALDSMAMRLYLYNARNLEHFELVYESKVRKAVSGEQMGMYKIFKYDKPPLDRPSQRPSASHP